MLLSVLGGIVGLIALQNITTQGGSARFSGIVGSVGNAVAKFISPAWPAIPNMAKQPATASSTTTASTATTTVTAVTTTAPGG